MGILLTLLVYVAILAIIYWLMASLSLPPPFDIVIKVVFAIVAIVMLLSLVGGFGGLGFGGGTLFHPLR